MDTISNKKAIFIIIFSLLAGAVGGFAIIWALLVKNIFGFAYSYSLLNTNIENRPVTIIEPREVTLDFDVAVENILSDVNRSTALLFNKKMPAATVLDGVYISSEAIGQAVAVTSDGWFMTAVPVDISTQVHVPALNNGNIFSISTITTDPQTDTSFFKIDISQDVEIVDLFDPSELNRGETVVIVNAQGESALGALLATESPRERTFLVRSSEEPISRPVVAVPGGVSSDGAHVYSTDGALIALADSNGELFSTKWSKLFPLVLRQETIERPYLGIHYVLLSDLISAEKKGLPDVHNGAWILGDAARPPVLRGSPAFDGGLSEGDIIVGVERENVTKTKDIEKLISQYQPGDTITLHVVTSEGEEVERKVTLESY